MTSSFSAAYFARDPRALDAAGAAPALVNVLELHWAGKLAAAYDAARALLGSNEPLASEHTQLLAAEAFLLSVKIGRPQRHLEWVQGLRAPLASLVAHYALFSYFFWVDQGQALRCLRRLAWLSLRFPGSGVLAMSLFLLGHMLAIAGFNRTGFLCANRVFRRFEARAPTKPFAEAIVFAAFPYTVLIAKRFHRIADTVRACRARLSPDPYYQSVFLVSALYAAAYTGDVAQADVLAALLRELHERTGLLRYRDISRIMPLLSMARRGYTTIIEPELEATLRGYDEKNGTALTHAQFFRAAAVISLCRGQFDLARTQIERAIRERQLSGLFRAWRDVDDAILSHALAQKVPTTHAPLAFGAPVHFEAPQSLSGFLVEAINSIPLAFTRGGNAFESQLAERLCHHLGCNRCTLGSTPVAVNDSAPQLRIGRHYLTLHGLPAERADAARKMLASLAPVLGIITTTVEQLLDLKAANERGSREAALARILQMLGHDVRRPFDILRMSIGSLNAVSTTRELRRTLKLVLPEVEEAARSVDDLITDVMRAATDTPLALACEDLDQLLAASLRGVLVLHPDADLRIVCEFGHCTSVAADAAQIQRVFSNIVQNAIQAMGGRGILSFRTRNLEEAGAERVELAIHNSGSHVPATDVETIFDSFFTRNKPGGTGLGLSIARRIVNAHGGRISCHSDPSGVEFVVTLPAGARLTRRPLPLPASSRELLPTPPPSDARAAPEPLTPSASDAAEPDPSCAPLLVAVVDDSRVFGRTVSALLTQIARVSCFTSPQEFWQSVAAQPGLLESFTALLTDYDFRGAAECGADFARSLREARPELPVLLSSSGAFSSVETERFDAVVDKSALDRDALLRALVRAGSARAARQSVRAEPQLVAASPSADAVASPAGASPRRPVAPASIVSVGDERSDPTSWARRLAARDVIGKARRRRTASLLASDVAHELASACAFLTSLGKRAPQDLALDGDDVLIAKDESERLLRLLAALRRVSAHPAPNATASLRSAAALACAALSVEPSPSLELPATLRVQGEEEQVALALTCLLETAGELAEHGAYGLRAEPRAERGITLEVWSRQPRARLGSGAVLPWQYCSEGGAGFGVAVAARVVRQLGWRFAVASTEHALTFRIFVPDTALPMDEVSP